MTLQRLKAWLGHVTEKLGATAPAWPPLIGFEGIAAEPEPDEQERRWLDEEERILPYLYWPNL